MSKNLPPLFRKLSGRLQSSPSCPIDNNIALTARNRLLRLNKNTIKIKIKSKNEVLNDVNYWNKNFKECCGSPSMWLSKTKKDNEKFSLTGWIQSNLSHNNLELITKFNNFCIKTSPMFTNKDIDIKPIDEEIIASSQEVLKSKDNMNKKQVNKSNTFKDISKSSSLNSVCSKGAEKKSLWWFQTMSKQLNWDQFLNLTIVGSTLTFKPWEIISETPHSTIYKCMNLSTAEVFISKSYINTCKSNIDKFENETSILASLNNENENIIHYYGSERVFTIPFIYFEYASHGSLRRMLESFGVFPEKLIQTFLTQLLNAWDYWHDKGIVHRDIKCANILLDHKGKIKLCDFGSAKRNTDEFKEKFTQSWIGTLPWCAPEVICNKPYGNKCDIWSLGCTVIEMTTGRNPWIEKKIDNYYKCVNIIGRGNDIPCIPELISSELKEFIFKCLKRNPDERDSIKMLKESSFMTKVIEAKE